MYLMKLNFRWLDMQHHMIVPRQHPHLGNSLEGEHWTIFHGDFCKFCKNTNWRWEVENHFKGKGKIEGENDRTSFFWCRSRRLCWRSFELDYRSIDNRRYEERERLLPRLFSQPSFSWTPKHSTGIILVFSISPKSNCYDLQQAS